jgi:hypothetical protein
MKHLSIRDPKYDEIGADHEVVFTHVISDRLQSSNVEALTHAELCALYVLIEQRLRLAGMSRPRIVRTGEVQVSYQNLTEGKL